MEENAAFVVKPKWCTKQCGYALQTVVRELAVDSIPALSRYSNVQDAFALGQMVFVMTREYYGYQAKVISSSAANNKGYVEVLLSEVSEPNTTVAVSPGPTCFMTANQVARECGLLTQLVSYITGKIFVIHGDKSDSLYGNTKSNIGLDLKFDHKNHEVIGYTSFCKKKNKWLYSTSCLELICSYNKQFPDMFYRMSTLQNMYKTHIYESDLWPDQVGVGKPEEVVAWLNRQAHTLASKRGWTLPVLEGEQLVSLAVSVDTHTHTLPHLDNDKPLSLQVKIHLLYKSDLYKGNLPPDSKADFQLYDRVVNVNNTIVPLGAKGTVSAIYCQPTLNSVHLSDNLNVEMIYQVLFDAAFPAGLTEEGIVGTRSYRLNASSLLNISYGRNLRENVNKNSQIEYLDWFSQYEKQRPQPTTRQCDHPYLIEQNNGDQNQKNKKIEVSNWRSHVLEVDDELKSSSAAFTSLKERSQYNQNQGRSSQKLTNYNNFSSVSDNMYTTAKPTRSKNSETGSYPYRAFSRMKLSPGLAEVSLRPAKVLSSNWRRDSEEHQRIPLNPSDLTQHPSTLPLQLSSLLQPPNSDQTHQSSFPIYQPMQHPCVVEPGSSTSALFPVQPSMPKIPDIPNSCQPKNKKP